MTLKFPKPKDQPKPRRPGIEVKLDGREVCDLSTRAGQREYHLRTIQMWHRQDGICPWCRLRIAKADASFDHEVPRGMGGAFRDDRIEVEVNGVVVWQNQCLHLWCNIRKGSKREVREDALMRQTAIFTEIGVDRKLQANSTADSGYACEATDEEISGNDGDGGGAVTGSDGVRS